MNKEMKSRKKKKRKIQREWFGKKRKKERN
jgi:hypothetical protein